MVKKHYPKRKDRIIDDLELVRRVRQSINTRGRNANRVLVVRIQDDVNDPGVRKKDIIDVARLLGYKTYRDTMAWVSMGKFNA